MLRMDMVTERRNRTMNTADKIKELVQTLNRHRHAYYNLNAPEISDAEYDRMYEQLESLEKETGIIYSNSPTQTVGYPPVSELEKVPHPHPLLSLDKTKQVEDLCRFCGNHAALLMLKLDGLTVKLTYENGRLTEASTRGDGEIGEDITHNIPTFENVPISIAYKKRLVVTGEAFIHRKDTPHSGTETGNLIKTPGTWLPDLCEAWIRKTVKDAVSPFSPSMYWRDWMRVKTATAGRNVCTSYQSWALVPARTFL